MPHQSQSPSPMIVTADAQHIPLADESVQCIVTSPPYYGLRRYAQNGECESVWDSNGDCRHEWGEELPGDPRGGSGTPTDKNNRGEGYGRDAPKGCFCHCGAWRGELGHEPTPELFVEHLVGIFREGRRVLRKDGTCWLILGDSYASSWPCSRRNLVGQGALPDGTRAARPERMGAGLKEKDLMGMPWMVAFGLRADGWWLRQDVVWSKDNPMPEPVRDRCTRSHEYVFMLTKSARYFYDADAVAEPRRAGEALRRTAVDTSTKARLLTADAARNDGDACHMGSGQRTGRNLRSVWRINTEPFSEAHYATFPRELARRCIRAGSREGDVVLDPFCGSGTTVEVANAERRVGIGLDLMHGYCTEHAVKRGRRGLAQGSQLTMEVA